MSYVVLNQIQDPYLFKIPIHIALLLIYIYTLPLRKLFLFERKWLLLKMQFSQKTFILVTYKTGLFMYFRSWQTFSVENRTVNTFWFMAQEVQLELFCISVQFSSVAQLCLTLYDTMNHSMPGLPVHHQLLEFTQTHVHRVSDAIQPSHPLMSPSPPAPNPSQHQILFQ